MSTSEDAAGWEGAYARRNVAILDELCASALESSMDDAFERLTVSAMEDVRLAEAAIGRERAELLGQRDAFRRRREAAMAGSSGRPNADDKLVLNAGGEVMALRRSTLSPRAHPVLAEVFSGAWDHRLLRDSEGSIFLDVDKGAFAEVRDYLLSCEKPGSNRRTLPPIERADAPLAALMALFHLHEDFVVSRPAPAVVPDLRSAAQHWPAVAEAVQRALDMEIVQYELAYDSTRDGWEPSEFHWRCAVRKFLLVAEDDSRTTVALCDIEWHGSNVGRWEGGFSTKSFVALFEAPSSHRLWLQADSSAPFKISSHESGHCAFGEFLFVRQKQLDFDLRRTPGQLLKSHQRFGPRFTLSVSRLRAYAVSAASIVGAAHAELLRRKAALQALPQQAAPGAATSSDGLPELMARVAGRMRLERAAIALEAAKLEAATALFARAESVVAFLSAGSPADIHRLNAGGSMSVRGAVLRTCGPEPSALARQFAADAALAPQGTVWIEADGASFRSLVNLLRIRCLPAELCPEGATPESLARRLVAAIPAEARELFEDTVRCYFPGEAAAFVLDQ